MELRTPTCYCAAMPRGPGPVAVVHRLFIVTALVGALAYPVWATGEFGHSALDDLRTRTSAIVPAFPLGEDGAVDLVLTRFEPFAPAARVDVVTDAGVHVAPLPDRVYFTGSVRGDPDTRAFLAAGRDSV